MPTCKCGSEFSEERALLGFETCPSCGDKAAQLEIARKEQRVGVVANKGGYEYIGSEQTFKDILKTAGSRKHIPIDTSGDVTPRPTEVKRHRQQPPTKQWTFSHWEFPVNEFGVRYKRAVLKLKLKLEPREED